MALTIDYMNKTAVVIGGTSGINLGIAEMFAKHGAAVAVASRSQDKVDACSFNQLNLNDFIIHTINSYALQHLQ